MLIQFLGDDITWLMAVFQSNLLPACPLWKSKLSDVYFREGRQLFGH